MKCGKHFCLPPRSHLAHQTLEVEGLELLDLAVGPHDDAVPLRQGPLQDLLGHAHLRVLELRLGRREVFLQPLNQLEPLPDVCLEAAVLEGTRDYLLFCVFLNIF